MMARLRYRAMYVTSSAAGYLLAAVMILFGARWRVPVRSLIRATAREHAEAAARKEGPYYAPVTFAIAVVIGTLGGVVLVRWLS